VTSRISGILAVVAAALLLSSCTSGVTTPPALAGDRTARLGAHNDTSTPFNFVSVPALTRHRYDGRGFRLEREVTRGLAFTRYAVSYRSGRLRVTGVMDVPSRAGRAPLVVLAHGWTDPRRYRSGAMLSRERETLAEHGFVALQIDYRNHAGSTREDARSVPRPLGYPEDLVNAVRAVRRADLPLVDASRVGLVGRSMGGGVVLNALAARPGLADAVVLYSPVSARAADSYHRWVTARPALRARVERAYGTPTSRPRVWARASAFGYLGRVDVPVRIHHGTADAVCPLRWSRATARALRAGGGDVRLHRYAGQDHRFHGAAWSSFMQRTARFLHAELG
jgi:dipeptidyl aminopeptidase/acylaminoacyl peptidase